MEVKAGRILRDQALEQRAAVHAFAGGNVDQARQDNLVHFRRRGQLGGPLHHRHKGILLRNLLTIHDIHWRLGAEVARRLLFTGAGEILPALWNKQLGRLVGIKRDSADHHRLTDPGSLRVGERGRHTPLKLPIEQRAIGGRVGKTAKTARGTKTAVRRHKEEAFRQQGHFLFLYILGQ